MKIICLASNQYINCVEPFAYYFNRFSGDDRRPVSVACYDEKPPNLPDNFEVIEIGAQSDYSWSTGLAKLLTLIDDEIILLMLEDYFLSKAVNWRVVESLLGLMQHDHDVIKCDLSDDRQKFACDRLGYFWGAEYLVSGVNTPFQASLQAALWRKDTLYSLLEPAENAWAFEKNGTKRLIAKRNEMSDPRFNFCQRLHVIGTMNPPMQYANAVGGQGGKPGVIEAKHMPDWMWEECVAKGWAHG